MKRHIAYALLASCAFTASAMAAGPERIRGTITSVDGDTLHVKDRAGKDDTITLSPDTKFGSLTKATLADIKQGTFIGTATKGSGDYLTALEVVVFPDSMRGTGEGHYAWDKIADTTQGSHHATSSSMTNGNVSAEAPASSGKTTNSSMTNGNVSAASSEGEAQKLTVTYKDPKTSAEGKQTIIVPPTAPIVMIAPADKTALVVGSKVFLVAAPDGGKLDAKLVAVGKDGVTPPM